MEGLPADYIYVPHHKGMWRGHEVTCLHTMNGNVLILYKDHWVFSKNCRIPKVPLIMTDLFGPIDDK